MPIKEKSRKEEKDEDKMITDEVVYSYYFYVLWNSLNVKNYFLKKSGEWMGGQNWERFHCICLCELEYIYTTFQMKTLKIFLKTIILHLAHQTLTKTYYYKLFPINIFNRGPAI